MKRLFLRPCVSLMTSSRQEGVQRASRSNGCSVMSIPRWVCMGFLLLLSSPCPPSFQSLVSGVVLLRISAWCIVGEGRRWRGGGDLAEDVRLGVSICCCCFRDWASKFYRNTLSVRSLRGGSQADNVGCGSRQGFVSRVGGSGGGLMLPWNSLYVAAQFPVQESLVWT